jgi:hypothetical protein
LPSQPRPCSLCGVVSRLAHLAMRYILRRPRFPVIIVAGDRVFRSPSPAGVKKVLRREAQPGVKVRLLDATWEWFEVLSDLDAIAPSLVDRAPPTKGSIVALVNGRSNRAPGAPQYEPRSLSNRTREDVLAGLLAVLPAG